MKCIKTLNWITFLLTGAAALLYFSIDEVRDFLGLFLALPTGFSWYVALKYKKISKKKKEPTFSDWQFHPYYYCGLLTIAEALSIFILITGR